MANYEALFTPFKIGNCEIRNRVIIPAMEGTNIVENMYGPHYNEKAWDYYIERAKNNVGLFIPGVILSVGYKPVQTLLKKDEHVHILGDAAAVGNLKKAIWGAYDLGIKL